MKNLEENDNWFEEVFISGSILVIDELWRLWPAGMRTSSIKMQHKTFLAEHRHMVGDCGNATEIVFVTQDLAQLATFSTLLIDTTFRVVKHSKLGSDKRYRVDIYSGVIKGQSPSASKRENEIHSKFKYGKGQTGDYYHTSTKSNVGAGDESRVDNRFKVFGSFKIKAMIAIFAFFIIVIYFLGKNFYDNSSFIKRDVEDAKPEHVEVTAPEREALSNKKSVASSNPTYISESKVQQTKTPVNELDLISQASNIFILGVIDDFYYFKVTKGDAVVFVKDSDLTSLGYTIEHINHCLVKIIGFNKSHFTYCQDNGNRNDFIRQPI